MSTYNDEGDNIYIDIVRMFTCNVSYTFKYGLQNIAHKQFMVIESFEGNFRLKFDILYYLSVGL